MIPVVISQTGTGATGWKNADYHRPAFNLFIGCTLSGGTATYSIETTNSAYLVSGTTVNVNATAIAGATAAAVVNITTPVRGWRINVTAGTGTVTAEAIQTGIA